MLKFGNLPTPFPAAANRLTTFTVANADIRVSDGESWTVAGGGGRLKQAVSRGPRGRPSRTVGGGRGSPSAFPLCLINFRC